MIVSMNNSINFGARFDQSAYQKLLNSVKSSHGLKMGVESRLSHICDWGDKDSVILLKKDNATERFVLRNDKYAVKEVPISKPVFESTNSIVIAFMSITKKVILDAEKLLTQGF